MLSGRDGRVRLLVAVVIVDILIAAALRGDEAARLGAGGQTWKTFLALGGLGWLVVVGVAVQLVVRQIGCLRREAGRREQALSADAGTSHEWVWELSPSLVWTYCGPRVTDILGYRPEELVGRSAVDLLPPEDAVRARQVVAEAIASGRGWSDVELRWRHADGHLVQLQSSGIPIFDEGRLVGFRGCRRNVPPSVARQRELADARLRVDHLIATRGLRPALQPIVSIGTGRLVGVEALARFGDGRSPEMWFQEARSIGLATRLERLALEAAFTTLPDLPESVFLSVNASPELILDPGFAAAVTGSGAIQRLVVEITEHLPIRQYDELLAVLAPLREQGLRLAVDDAGAGYASFNHILRLRPDVIKLDRSLVADVQDDPARRALITAVVLVGFELGAGVTAEGVETPAELETLTTLGVDTVQGYLLARPEREAAQWRRWPGRTWFGADGPSAFPAAPARGGSPSSGLW